MKTKKSILIAVITSFIIALMLTSCGGRSDNKEKESPRLMPSEHGSMTESQISESSSDNMHKQHNNLAENFVHKDIIILDEVYPVKEQTQAELDEVVDSYLLMKDALVNGDVAATDKAVNLMLSKIKAVKPDKLDGEGLDAWKDHIRLYEDKLKEMQHVNGLEEKRSYFGHLSEIMYCTIKSFGLKEGNLYAIYCPMAFDGKGAYWIAESKTIQNPYFGDKMPTCGEIKEEF
ncbi:DUF3347 domain-containing protein [Sunxiuqinia dokdonensis]|uniref:DUF3347 domain-containing protein n=1 Tax=Sunxiuqinia dokdonensis TaxID=1409788 RepID=A0A0L8V5R7_9BACT|nr:DUF3347 domain-containing protein [Sunxiuqinia dokdonensis]KOH43683.1 hypothetical protein NC99_34520 [Sunxiuqinia dokdonensis]|tara:strand:- start:3373 stop:4068 length:696 start_codon:yes stop_codon:yes gene_type:complete